MRVFDYSRRGFLAALSSAVARANFIISIIIVIAGAAIWFAPSLGMTIDASELMTTLRSPAFLTALVGAVILFRLVCAQYWIWTEERASRIKAELQVEELFARHVPSPNTMQNALYVEFLQDDLHDEPCHLSMTAL